MPTCENCQVVFKLPEQPVEITSTRVLCAKCEREYRAEKARRLAAKAGGHAPASSPTSSPAASHSPSHAASHSPSHSAGVSASKPVPASVPIALAAKSAKPAAAPARDATGHQASAHATAGHPSAGHTSAGHTAAGHRAPAAHNAAPAAAHVPPKAKPSPKSTHDDHDAEQPKKRSRDVERGTELLKQRSNRSLTIVWTIAAVLLLVAGGVVFQARRRQAKEDAAIAARAAEVKAFKTKFFDSFDITREQEALAAIAYAEGNPSKWKYEDIEVDVNNRVAKAKTNVEAAQLRAGYFERLTKIEEVVADETSTTQVLTEMRRSIDELVPKADIVGTEFSARLGAARVKVVKAVAVGLHEEARVAALDTNNARAALQKYALAEEEIKPLMDDAYHKGNTEDLTFFLAHYKDIIKESDALCAALFTTEVIEKTPWTDLLSGDQVKLWRASENVSGFEHRIDKGVLQIVGPDAAAAGKQGVMSIGDTELWRDFVLEFEFTLEKGSVDMFLRLPKNTVPDQTIEVIALATQGESAFVAGEAYECELSMIGSTQIYSVHSVEFRPQENAIPWSKARKGSILLAIPTNTSIKFTKMRIRELR